MCVVHPWLLLLVLVTAFSGTYNFFQLAEADSDALSNIRIRVNTKCCGSAVAESCVGTSGEKLPITIEAFGSVIPSGCCASKPVVSVRGVSAPGNSSVAASRPADGVIWNLSSFGWKSVSDPTIKEYLDDLDKKWANFHKDYVGKVKTNLESALKARKVVEDMSGKLGTFLSLHSSTGNSDDRILSTVSMYSTTLEKMRTKYGNFFSEELLEIDDIYFDDILARSPELKKYRYVLESQRSLRDHMLSPEVEYELLIREPYSCGGASTNMFFQELAEFEVLFDGKIRGLKEVTSYMSSPIQSIRWKAAEAINFGLGERKIADFAALSLNSVAGTWYINSIRRKYKELRSARNLSNGLSDQTVSVLLNSISTKGSELTKKFLKTKKVLLETSIDKTLGFSWKDLSAPVAGGSEKLYTWEEAVDLVAKTFGDFDDSFRVIFLDLIERSRIDSRPRVGKDPGSYCTFQPGLGAFVLLNFMGSKDDVMGLAHEAGHAIHYVLTESSGNHLMSSEISMPVVETAAIFAECLMFKALLDATTTNEERLSMLSWNLDRLVRTIIRQGVFDSFEESVHKQREFGELSRQDISNLWVAAARKMYGNGEDGVFDDNFNDYENGWSSIHHFHSSAFYVYSYAFAQLTANELHIKYMKELKSATTTEISNSGTFVEKYIDFLKSGGYASPTNLFGKFGLEIDSCFFWNTTLDNSLGKGINDLILQAQINNKIE